MMKRFKKNEIRIDRLAKLAQHLETGELGHRKFDFCSWNNLEFPGDKVDKRGCGTAGCAIGETPIVFPRLVKFAKSKVDNQALNIFIYGKDQEKLSGAGLAGKLFNIDCEMIDHLFKPEMQQESCYGGKYLGMTATRKEVAKNIREFIKLVEEGEITLD